MLVICDCYLTTISQTLEIFVYYTMKCGMWVNTITATTASLELVAVLVNGVKSILEC
ncbi:hypothetical protein KBT16_29435 [Nostoc sp. CCCryo 231-06]|nr:hypothetical protein [Nostoc sp. CCCryo 231-06]